MDSDKLVMCNSGNYRNWQIDLRLMNPSDQFSHHPWYIFLISPSKSQSRNASLRSKPKCPLANPAPSPETGLISIRFKHPFSGCRIRSLNAGCRMPSVLHCQQCSLLPAVFFTARLSQARFLQPPLQQPQLLQPPLLQPQLLRPGTPEPRISRPSSVVRRPSSVICRPSSIVQLFVPLR